MKKILSLLLIAMLLVSTLPAAYAVSMTCPICSTNSFHKCDLCGYDMKCDGCGYCLAPDCNMVTHAAGTDVEYDANDQDGDGQLDNLEYYITVPAKLTPGNASMVILEGMWPSYATVKVTADKTVDMLNNITNGNLKTLDIFFDGISLAGNNEVAITRQTEGATAPIGVDDISDVLFGKWKGHFYYQVEYVAEIEMITFTIDGTLYQAVDGMTWRDWVASEYNTDGFNHFSHDLDNNTYSVDNATHNARVAMDGREVTDIETIIANYDYHFSYPPI